MGARHGSRRHEWSRRGRRSVLCRDAPGRYLFALLDEGTEQIAYYTLFAAGDHDRERQATELETLRETREVPSNQYPLLVTFTDIDDPTTVQRVDPANLAVTFGPGFLLRRIMLEITDEKVSKDGVRKLLPWLSDYPEPPLLPKIDPKDFSFAALRRHGDFIRQ